jgi:hypothetical protein
MGSGFESSHVQVDNNSIHYSEMLVSNDTYVTSVHDNHFINSRITLGNNATFKNNHVKVTSAVVVGAGDTIIGGIVEDSTFYSNVLTPKLSYNIDADKMVNCKFNNIDVYSSKSSSSRLVTFERCRFNNSTMITRANTNDTTVRVTELNQCELIDTIVSLIYSSAGVSKSKASLKDCTIKAINNTSVFFVNSNGAQSVELYVENSKVSISSNLTSLFTFNYAVANTTTFTLKGSVIEYLGTTPLSTNYFADGGNNIYKSTIAGNIMKNIVFGTLTGSKYITYNPDTHSLSEPTSGYYAQGKLVHNAAPTSGGYLGWVTITEGFANNVSWAASTAYTVGQQVNANNKVYQCTVAGTSGSTAPSHSTGTATDGTVSPVTWMYMSPKAVFKTYGIISS